MDRLKEWDLGEMYYSSVPSYRCFCSRQAKHSSFPLQPRRCELMEHTTRLSVAQSNGSRISNCCLIQREQADATYFCLVYYG